MFVTFDSGQILYNVVSKLHFTVKSIRPVHIGEVIRISEECGLSRWSAADYLNESERDDSIMLRLEDERSETAGFLVGRRVPGSRAGSVLDAEIYNIGVRKSFQRSGCGSMLLIEFLDQCASYEVDTIWLDVRVSNTGAISFYRTFGFEDFTVRSSFYSDPAEDGMVMKLTIGKQNS